MESLEHTNAYVLGWGEEGNALRLELNALARGQKEPPDTLVTIPLEQASD